MSAEVIEVREGDGGRGTYVRGTRVRVSDVAQRFELILHEFFAERVRDRFESLTIEEVQAALAYWREHREEIQDEIEQDLRVYNSMPTTK